MRYNSRGYQRQAARYAEDTERDSETYGKPEAYWQRLRAENARRMAAARHS